MKTTIDLPNHLMDEIKVLAAREQREVGEVMVELVQKGMEYRARPVGQTNQQTAAERWLEDWLKLAACRRAGNTGQSVV